MRRCTLSAVLLLAAVSPAQRPLLSIEAKHPDRPLICAHRGRLNGNELENSLTVMRHTLGAGVPMMEFDLRKNSEGDIFLLHDATLDRTTNATGALAHYSDAQLARVMQRDPKTGAALEALTRYEDLLQWAQGNNALLLVDLKETPPAEAVAALRRYGLIDRAVLLIFDAKTYAAALASDPTVLVSALAHTNGEIDAAVASAGTHPLALYLPSLAGPSLYAYAQTTGKIVISDAMGELDESAAARGPEVYRAYLQTHPVDILVTDHSLELANALRQTVPQKE
jgi:glycerophosphoryl diester phosphodiesterase